MVLSTGVPGFLPVFDVFLVELELVFCHDPFQALFIFFLFGLQVRLGRAFHVRPHERGTGTVAGAHPLTGTLRAVTAIKRRTFAPEAFRTLSGRHFAGEGSVGGTESAGFVFFVELEKLSLLLRAEAVALGHAVGALLCFYQTAFKTLFAVVVPPAFGMLGKGNAAH